MLAVIFLKIGRYKGGEILASILRMYITSFLKAFFSKWLEDFFIVAGAGVMVWTTYQLNEYVGHYMVSAILILIGIFLAKNPPKR